GWPLVAKQICTNVMHKSDLGLVRVGIHDTDELNKVITDFNSAVAEHDLAPEGVLLAEMRAGAEVIVGGVRDPKFGPLVMIGVVGILAELLDDVVFRQAAINQAEAAAALDELTIGTMLRGYRETTYDRDAVVQLIADFSEVFAASDWLTQADLNPVM